MIREAEERLAKPERFLAQAAVLSPESTPEAIIHLTYYAMLHAAAADRAEDMRLASDYVANEIPSASDVVEVRDTARDFLAYCRSLL